MCPDLGGDGGGSGVVGCSLAERPVEDGAPIVLYIFGQLAYIEDNVSDNFAKYSKATNAMIVNLQK